LKNAIAFSGNKRRWWLLPLRFLPLLLLGIFVYRERPWEANLPPLMVWPLCLAILMNFTMYIPAKALRWRVVLQNPPPLIQIIAATLEGFLANIAIGFSSGELVRSARLHRTNGTFVTNIGAVLAERATEYSVLAFLLALAGLVGLVPKWFGAGAGLIVITYLVILATRQKILPRLKSSGRISTGIRTALSALTPRKILLMTLLSLAGWTVEIGMLSLTFYALGLPVRLSNALYALVGINTAIGIPGPPANLGTFEAGAVAALMLQGIDKTSALAFALVYHMLHVIPVALVSTIVYLVRGPGEMTPEETQPTNNSNDYVP
jgi:uncharacterized protein (TIRG00374 family)